MTKVDVGNKLFPLSTELFSTWWYFEWGHRFYKCVGIYLHKIWFTSKS